MNYDLKPVYSLAESKLDVVGESALVIAIDSIKNSDISSSWPAFRKIVGYVQTILKDEVNHNIVVDGWYGEQTDDALDDYFNGPQDWRTDVPDYSDINQVYGSIETVGRKIVRITPPYDHYLAWAPTTKASKVSCHERIADAYHDILKDVVRSYGKDQIRKLNLDQFGGSYVAPPRLMRGGSKYSTHCWGIAFDYDPSHNQLKWGGDKAALARIEYEDWRAIWKEHGAIGLGETKNYDWMHWQFSRP